MIIGDRLRMLRIEKKLSLGEIGKRSGLLRCHISRVENGHTVSNVETKEELARALEVPLCAIFFEGGEQPKPPKLLKRKSGNQTFWGNSGKDSLILIQFRRLLGPIGDEDQRLLKFLANKMAPYKTKR